MSESSNVQRRRISIVKKYHCVLSTSCILFSSIISQASSSSTHSYRYCSRNRNNNNNNNDNNDYHNGWSAIIKPNIYGELKLPFVILRHYLDQNNDEYDVTINSVLSIRGGTLTEDDEAKDIETDEEEKESVNIEKGKSKKDKGEATHGRDNNMNELDYVLSNLYNVPATRQEWIQKKIRRKSKSTSSRSILPIQGGSLTDALELARSKGRLLLILIPTTTAGGGKSKSKLTRTPDQDAIESFISADVTKVAEGKVGTNKKEKDSSSSSDPLIEQKSFVLWTAMPNSIEATHVLKRVNGIQGKNVKTGKKCPILAVLYPSRSSSTVIVPQLIAQHHCNPPPNTQTMVAWLQSIRQRCRNYYKQMNIELQENEYYKQRIEGYKGSIRTDVQRKHNEQIEKLEREYRIEQQRNHTERIQQRRLQLKELLVPEPPPVLAKSTSSSKLPPIVTTIALRFADGTIMSSLSTTTKPSDTRRFLTDETTLADVFNWIDVEYEVEREHIVLQSMKNDGTEYRWIEQDEDEEKICNDSSKKKKDNEIDNNNNNSATIMSKTLSELGLGKMIAFRVSIVSSSLDHKKLTISEEKIQFKK
jgi:hypothetical protein